MFLDKEPVFLFIKFSSSVHFFALGNTFYLEYNKITGNQREECSLRVKEHALLHSHIV